MDNTHLTPYYNSLLSDLLQSNPHHLTPPDITAILALLNTKPLDHIFRLNKKSMYYNLMRIYLEDCAENLVDNVYRVEGVRKIDRRWLKREMRRTEEKEECEGENKEREEKEDLKEDLKKELKENLKEDLKEDLKECEAPKKIPNKTPNKTLNKKLTQKFFNTLTTLNITTNQELVSLIPSTILLALTTPTSTILDICAAPGSKSSHLIENDRFVISNDVNFKRCEVICRRIENAVVLNCNGVSMRWGGFDGVLCDAPCSGDGTFRKNFLGRIHKKRKADHKKEEDHEIHEKEEDHEIHNNNPHNNNHNPKNSYSNNPNTPSLHSNPKLNISLLRNSIHLCTPSKYIVYSTCSLTPIENEYVIQEVLDIADIVDIKSINDCLFNFVEKGTKNIENKKNTFTIFYRKGVKNWSHSVYKSKGCKEMEKCLRFYPHDNNSGGFFVCVLRKKEESKESKERKERNEESKVSKEESNKTTKQNNKQNTKQTSKQNTIQTTKQTTKQSPQSLTINSTKYHPLPQKIKNALLTHHNLQLKRNIHFYSTKETNNRIVAVDERCFCFHEFVGCGCVIFERIKSKESESKSKDLNNNININNINIYKPKNLSILSPFLISPHTLTKQHLHTLLKQPLFFNDLKEVKNDFIIFKYNELYFKGRCFNGTVVLYLSREEREVLKEVL